MNRIRAHTLISGRVQGVGYRFTTQDVAIELGINGWVRNLPDGRVEAVFEGTETQVKQMLDWCQQGPRGAIVKSIDVQYETPESLQGFDIRR